MKPIKPLSLGDHYNVPPIKFKPSFDAAPRLLSNAEIAALLRESPRDPLADLHSSFQAALDALPISIEAAHREYAKINRRYIVCFRLIDNDGVFHSGAIGLQSGGMSFTQAYQQQYIRQRYFALAAKNAKVRFWLEVVE